MSSNLAKSIRESLNNLYQDNLATVEVVEPTEEELIVREVMEEPMNEIHFKVTLTIPNPIEFIRLVHVF